MSFVVQRSPVNIYTIYSVYDAVDQRSKEPLEFGLLHNVCKLLRKVHIKDAQWEDTRRSNVLVFRFHLRNH
jgi:hypothetical protein